MPRVMFQGSGVRCQVSNFIIIFFLQSVGACRWRVCYQWGLTHQVYSQETNYDSALVTLLRQNPGILVLIFFLCVCKLTNTTQQPIYAVPYVTT